MSIIKSRRLRRDEWGSVVELVSNLAAGENPRPRLDVERVSEAEAVELAELAEQIRFGEVDRMNARFWKLVAKASGFPDDHFDRRAREAKAARKAAEREAKERRLRFSRREESGFFRAAAAALHAEDCWIDDVAVMVAVLAQFASGRPFNGSSHFTGSGRDAALVVDWNKGGLFGPVDGQGRLDNVRSRLDFLQREGWIIVLEARGPVRSIKLGPRLLDALDDVPVGEELVV